MRGWCMDGLVVDALLDSQRSLQRVPWGWSRRRSRLHTRTHGHGHLQQGPSLVVLVKLPCHEHTGEQPLAASETLWLLCFSA